VRSKVYGQGHEQHDEATRAPGGRVGRCCQRFSGHHPLLRAGRPAAGTSRSPAGYRLYDPATVERLRFIQGCQRLGLKLRDITDLLAVRDTGTCPCEPAADLLQRRLAELDADMARLTALRLEITAMADALPAPDCPPPAPGTAWCPPDEGR
jgi:hypothetical protein